MTESPPRWRWAHTPSTTIAGDTRITAREHHYHGEQNATAFRLTADQMATLQTYPTERSTVSTETAVPCIDVVDENGEMIVAGSKYAHHAVVDLFAGTGVAVALKRMGVKDYGVEWMPEANAVRAANGFETIYQNVWDAHLLEERIAAGLYFDTIWASPPCQTFSLAGNGAGRRALTDVLGVIHRKQYLDMDELREQAALLGDERIGLVLSPLHYVARFMPTYVAFEQVPAVLPVWQAMQPELEELGYSVWVGYRHSEMDGVPQTRKRAYLMARRDGYHARPPKQRHSKYHSRDPKKLDPGYPSWISMEQALERIWAGVDRPAPTVTGGAPRQAEPSPSADGADRRSGTPGTGDANDRL